MQCIHLPAQPCPLQPTPHSGSSFAAAPLRWDRQTFLHWRLAWALHRGQVPE